MRLTCMAADPLLRCGFTACMVAWPLPLLPLCLRPLRAATPFACMQLLKKFGDEARVDIVVS